MNPASPDAIFVLLVEDSPADVFLVSHAMEQEGLDFTLELADDGDAAIAIIDRVDTEASHPAPDLLLLDINVPRRTGNDVLERVRRSPRCMGIPVVMISSSDSPVDRQRAFDLGATEYFRKPSTLDEFLKLGHVVRRVAMARVHERHPHQQPTSTPERV
ncbi:MAG: response regulator [Acidobacteriia bacterium]|nr:response regulator [Terriglobia bacterium]